MINIIPQSEVRLLKTPLEKDSEHTLNFASLQDQTTYFLSRVQKSYTDFTYIREQQAIVIPETYDSVYTCNYLMYKNNGFNNKYFYAFITKMEYVSENSTRVYFEIDSLQTWFFQINMNQVFIEREHVSDDTIGLHTVPEELETGEYVSEERTLGESISFNYLWRRQGESAVIRKKIITIAITESPFALPAQAKIYNGVYSGLYYIVCKTAQDADNYIKYAQSQFSEDPIYSIFLIPEQFTTNVDWITSTEGGHTFEWGYLPSSTDTTILQNAYVNKTNKLGNNYIPVNNKLLTFPYKYFIVSNNSGSSATYKYEMFSGLTECNFDIEGVPSVGCSIKLVPKNYQNESKNILYSLDSGKLPTCSWTNDPYTNWLTGNSVNIGIGIAEDLIKVGTGVATGNTGSAIGGLSSITHTIGEIYSKSTIPNTGKGGVNMGDFNIADSLTFTLHKKVIKEEYATIIDKYFTMYGYKVNIVKVPNINSRRNFNFIKTIECNFTGDIPQEDLQKIKDIFNKGITFWHNANNFLDYSVNNDII